VLLQWSGVGNGTQFMERIGESRRGRMVLLLEIGRSCGSAVGWRQGSCGQRLLAARVVVALYDELCGHDEPHTPDRAVKDAFDDDPPARRPV
jgi:hypothetical protein